MPTLGLALIAKNEEKVLSRYKSNQPNFKDITGRQFGFYTAIRYSRRRRKATLWLCRCVCGEEREVILGNLQNGNSTNCGCKRTKRTREGRLQYDREWRKRNPEKVRSYCKKYKERNPEKVKEYERNNNLKQRANRRITIIATKFALMEMYGSLCVGCGCNELAILTIDHVNDDGCLDRKLGSNRGIVFYRKLLKQQRRVDLQILCSNCQSRKRYYGPDISTWPSKVIKVP